MSTPIEIKLTISTHTVTIRQKYTAAVSTPEDAARFLESIGFDVVRDSSAITKIIMPTTKIGLEVSP